MINYYLNHTQSDSLKITQHEHKKHYENNAVNNNKINNNLINNNIMHNNILLINNKNEKAIGYIQLNMSKMHWKRIKLK